MPARHQISHRCSSPAGGLPPAPQSAPEDRHQEEKTHYDGLHLASLLERRGVATHHSGITPYSRSKGWFATPHPKRYNPATHDMSLTRADQHLDQLENRVSLVYLLCESGRLEEKEEWHSRATYATLTSLSF